MPLGRAQDQRPRRRAELQPSSPPNSGTEQRPQRNAREVRRQTNQRFTIRVDYGRSNRLTRQITEPRTEVAGPLCPSRSAGKPRPDSSKPALRRRSSRHSPNVLVAGSQLRASPPTSEGTARPSGPRINLMRRAPGVPKARSGPLQPGSPRAKGAAPGPRARGEPLNPAAPPKQRYSALPKRCRQKPCRYQNGSSSRLAQMPCRRSS